MVSTLSYKVILHYEEEVMKKILIAVLVLLIGNWLWGNLQDHYKKGTIVLKGAAGFGEGNDWEGLFYDPYKNMVVAPDGTIFVSNNRTNNVFKFDKQGKLLKKFGREGNGPGDFLDPGNLTILDNKYLVVAEYPLKRRFSLWDLEGKYIKVVKTNTNIFSLTALRDNRAAYYFFSQHPEKWNGFHRTVSIIIKDIDSGKEKVIQKITLLDRSSITVEKNICTEKGNFFGEVYLAQTIDGNLAIGISNQPKIKIYSPDGNMIHSFDLKIEPVAVTKKYLKEFRENVMADLKRSGESYMNATEKFWYEMGKKTFSKFDFSTIFDKYLPLYNEILVDSEGNFLVFKFTECQRNCIPLFQVYSKEGKFICECQLDRGKYELEIDRRFKKIFFTSEGIFALLMERGDEDEILRLVKSYYLPVP
jgi:hypothetical protein